MQFNTTFALLFAALFSTSVVGQNCINTFCNKTCLKQGSASGECDPSASFCFCSDDGNAATAKGKNNKAGNRKMIRDAVVAAAERD